MKVTVLGIRGLPGVQGGIETHAPLDVLRTKRGGHVGYAEGSFFRPRWFPGARSR